MEKYLGHKCGEREQSLKEHLEETARLSGMFAGRFGKADWGYCCGLLHDIGKYSEAFQKKIREESGRQVDHSSAGMQLCYEMGGLYGFMGYCIAGHHTGLLDYSGSSSSLCERRKKKLEGYGAWRDEIEIPPLRTRPIDTSESVSMDFSLSVFMRMLYSCLVDADFLDTERFMKGGTVKRDSGESMEALFSRLEKRISGWLENYEMETVNGRRTQILRSCLDCGPMDQGIFRLTVPTGGGKTIASLAFALRHAVEHHMDRVIYVIPYTSIIEQNARVFREILGSASVLENHSQVQYRAAENEEEQNEIATMNLAAENWDKPVIVTTSVQFFESLYGNRPSRCRKLHNIANSVIIFDEVQMLPVDYLKPCTAMMEELTANYRASIVLCTATQPALEPFLGHGRRVTELCPEMESQFRFFERVHFRNLGCLKESILCGYLRGEKAALCIVNTRKQAQTLYRELKGEGVFHLSTTMYPAHRRRVLAEIRERLDRIRRKPEEKLRCLVISTSLVEAGVDLDFDAVYRQLAGVDSMVQAAGRCNREGKRSAEKSLVSVFWPEGKKDTLEQELRTKIAEALLTEGKDLFAPETVEEYFKRLYHYREGSLDKKNILEEFKGKRYFFAKVGKEFRLIGNETVTVLVPSEEEAVTVLKRIQSRGATKEEMRRAEQYCVQIRKDLSGRMEAAGMVLPVSEELEDFYVLTRTEQYTEDMGLNLEVETGTACFL